VNPYGAPKVAVAAETAEPQPVNLFSVSGRIGRLRYIAYGVLVYAVLVLLSAVLGAVLGPLGPAGVAIGALLPWAVIIVLSFMLTIQRCHDFNASGWLSLLGLVPLVNLVFWFIPGSDGPNRYGPPTPPNGVMVYIGAVVAPVVIVSFVGILAAVAIPAYSDYTRRAQVSAVIAHGTLWRTAVEEHYRETNKLPASAAELKSAPPSADQYSSASLGENGVIVMTLSAKMGSGANKTVLLRPTTAGARVTWDCTGGTLEAKYRPARCRAQ
jgi:uncharacterized membrane protein YhaH (DUF805 family)/Tfp pilus assembly protein PilE